MVHTLCFAMLVDCISSLYMLCVFVFFSSAFLLHLKLLYFVYVFFVFLCCISSVLGFLITLNLLNSWRSMSHDPQEGTLHSVAVRNMACRKYAIVSDPKSTRSGDHKWRTHGFRFDVGNQCWYIMVHHHFFVTSLLLCTNGTSLALRQVSKPSQQKVRPTSSNRHLAVGLQSGEQCSDDPGRWWNSWRCRFSVEHLIDFWHHIDSNRWEILTSYVGDVGGIISSNRF